MVGVEQIPTHTILISNICQIQNIDGDDIMIDGVMHINLLDKSYKLTENIEANYTAAWNGGAGFNPIGDNIIIVVDPNDFTKNIITRFEGTFDGGGFTLSTLTINRSDTDYVGLFGFNSGTIKNITVDNVDIAGRQYTGGLVGQNATGIINDSTSFGDVVAAANNIGGFIGQNYEGLITNSNSFGSVNGVSNVGGFVGLNNGTINDSTSFGDVVATGSNIGGFVGRNDIEESNPASTINDSRSSGSVSGSVSVGVFVGRYNGGSFSDDTWCRHTDNSSLPVVGVNPNNLDTNGITTREPDHADCP